MLVPRRGAVRPRRAKPQGRRMPSGRSPSASQGLRLTWRSGLQPVPFWPAQAVPRSDAAVRPHARPTSSLPPARRARRLAGHRPCHGRLALPVLRGPQRWAPVLPEQQVQGMGEVLQQQSAVGPVLLAVRRVRSDRLRMPLQAGERLPGHCRASLRRSGPCRLCRVPLRGSCATSLVRRCGGCCRGPKGATSVYTTPPGGRFLGGRWCTHSSHVSESAVTRLQVGLRRSGAGARPPGRLLGPGAPRAA